MQYMDADFNEFMNLTSLCEIQHKSTLKVIYIPILSPEEPCITLYTMDSFDEPFSSSGTQPETRTSSIASTCSDDTLYTSTIHPQKLLGPPGPMFLWSPNSPTRLNWSYNKRILSETNGTYFNPGPKLKGVILDGLAQEIMKYTKYPKDYQCEEIASTLTKVHPCLGQLGSKTGFWRWKQSLKYKMQNYRTKLVRLGHPEICVNSMKHKREGQGKAAANIKKQERLKLTTFLSTQKGKPQRA